MSAAPRKPPKKSIPAKLSIGEPVEGVEFPPLPKRKKTTRLIVHCSATRASQDISASDIHTWHKARKWKGLGYHVVIRRDGTIERGRPLDTVGSHARGFNHTSVGICLVGGLKARTIGDLAHPRNIECNFTMAQWDSLRTVLTTLRLSWPEATVVGHRDLDQKKACPTFNASALFGS